MQEMRRQPGLNIYAENGIIIIWIVLIQIKKTSEHLQQIETDREKGDQSQLFC